MLGNKTPELSDLYKNIVPKVAARWKDLGLELNIPIHQLEIIEVDHVNHPRYNEKCCQAMFQRWLQSTIKPSWDELQKAIDNLPGLLPNGGYKSKEGFIS